MTVTVPLSVTDEDLVRIGDANPGWRVEIVDGSVVMSPTNNDAGRRSLQLALLLGTWARQNGYVAFDSSTGFRLDPKNLLSPDLALMATARWNALSPERQASFDTAPPDVVVELCSAKYHAVVERRKCARWMSFGVHYAIMLDPFATGEKVEMWGTPPEGFPTDWTSVVD